MTGIELAVARQLREVSTELVEHRRTRGVVARRRTLAGTDRLLALVARHQLDDLLAHPAQIGPEADQNGGGHALAFTDETEEHVLGADVAVPQLQRFAQGELQHLLGAWRERWGAAGGRAGHTHRLFDFLADSLQRNAERLERFGRDALALVDQSEQDVLGPDETVVQ